MIHSLQSKWSVEGGNDDDNNKLINTSNSLLGVCMSEVFVCYYLVFMLVWYEIKNARLMHVFLKEIDKQWETNEEDFLGQ